MKKYVLMMAVIMALMAPQMAWSKSKAAATTATTTPAAAAAPAAASSSSASASDFQAQKDKALANANKHLSMWQTRISCLQAATTSDAVKACTPSRK